MILTHMMGELTTWFLLWLSDKRWKLIGVSMESTNGENMAPDLMTVEEFGCG